MKKNGRTKIKIKETGKKTDISLKESYGIDYPVFSFKYLQNNSIEECVDHNFLKGFLFRLQKLSELGWSEIRTSQRHGFGMEKIPVSCIKPKNKLNISILTPDVEHLTVFRATGDNRPFLGIEQKGVFHIIFVETEFGHIYDHG